MLLFVLFATELLFKEEVTSFDAFSSSSHTETSPPCDAKHLNPFFFFVVFFVVIVAFVLFFFSFSSFEIIIIVLLRLDDAKEKEEKDDDDATWLFAFLAAKLVAEEE
jgi:hypothetical protein